VNELWSVLPAWFWWLFWAMLAAKVLLQVINARLRRDVERLLRERLDQLEREEKQGH